MKTKNKILLIVFMVFIALMVKINNVDAQPTLVNNTLRVKIVNSVDTVITEEVQR